MLGPITRAVENRGSSTENARASRMTATAVAWLVTSQPPSAGIQATGLRSRNSASRGCGSCSSSLSVSGCPFVVPAPPFVSVRRIYPAGRTVQGPAGADVPRRRGSGRTRRAARSTSRLSACRTRW